MVTETTNRPRGRASHRPQGALLQRRSRLVVFLAFVLGLACGYGLGYFFAHEDLKAAKQLVAQLQAEGQRLKKEIAGQAATLVTLQAELSQTRSALNALMPTKDTYNLNPNESLVLDNGLLTIGLVGTPTNDNITININGKRYAAVSGDVINVSPNGSTNCRLEVQSFDMFKAVVTASCAPK